MGNENQENFSKFVVPLSEMCQFFQMIPSVVFVHNKASLAAVLSKIDRV